MKRLILLSAVCAAVLACAPETYSINGTVTYDDCDGADAILYYNSETDTTTVDGHTFSFTGDFVEPEVALVVIRNGSMRNMYCYFVMEPGEVGVEVSDTSRSTGSQLNDECTAYQHIIRARADERRAALKAVKADSLLTDEERNAAKDRIWEAYYAFSDSLDSEIFTAHPNDILGSHSMMSLSSTKERFDSLYAIAGDNVKNSAAVVKEKQRYEKEAATAVGHKFVDFTVPTGTADGKSVSLSDYVGKGKYILVDFWASWCSPCRAMMPYIAAAYEKYKGDNFEVVGVAVWDKREDTEKVLPTLPISWPVIFDAQKEPTTLYGINGIPHLILFGPDGTILARGFEGEEIEPTLAEYLK